jgi:hypothetical protein
MEGMYVKIVRCGDSNIRANQIYIKCLVIIIIHINDWKDLTSK